MLFLYFAHLSQCIQQIPHQFTRTVSPPASFEVLALDSDQACRKHLVFFTMQNFNHVRCQLLVAQQPLEVSVTSYDAEIWFGRASSSGRITTEGARFKCAVHGDWRCDEHFLRTHLSISFYMTCPTSPHYRIEFTGENRTIAVCVRGSRREELMMILENDRAEASTSRREIYGLSNMMTCMDLGNSNFRSSAGA